MKATVLTPKSMFGDGNEKSVYDQIDQVKNIGVTESYMQLEESLSTCVISHLVRKNEIGSSPYIISKTKSQKEK